MAIEWIPEAIQIDENHEKALIIKDPLTIVAKILNLSAPADAVREEFGPITISQFWKLFQEIVTEELNVRLRHIQGQTSAYQEELALQMRFMQIATMNLTTTVLQLKSQLETKVAEQKVDAVLAAANSEPMDFEWTPPSYPLPDMPALFAIEAKKCTPRDDSADERDCTARGQRQGTLPPATPRSTLGTSQSTSRKRSTTLNGGKGGSCAPPKGPSAKNPWDSSSDSDSDPSEDERPKKKLTTQQLLAKYVTAMVKDQKKKDKAQAPKPQPYKGDPEDLKRFIRQLENV